MIRSAPSCSAWAGSDTAEEKRAGRGTEGSRRVRLSTDSGQGPRQQGREQDDRAETVVELRAPTTCPFPTCRSLRSSTSGGRYRVSSDGVAVCASVRECPPSRAMSWPRTVLSVGVTERPEGAIRLGPRWRSENL